MQVQHQISTPPFQLPLFSVDGVEVVVVAPGKYILCTIGIGFRTVSSQTPIINEHDMNFILMLFYGLLSRPVPYLKTDTSKKTTERHHGHSMLKGYRMDILYNSSGNTDRTIFANYINIYIC